MFTEFQTSPAPKLSASNRTPARSSASASGNWQSPTPSKRAYTARRTDGEKLEDLLRTLAEMRWSIGYLLYQLFREKDTGGNDVHRSQRHSQSISAFLKGQCDHSPTDIIQLIFRHSDGRPPPRHVERGDYFSEAQSLPSIKYAQPAISTWALELVGKQLIAESNQLIAQTSGLRVRATSKTTAANVSGRRTTSPAAELQPWEDIGEDEGDPDAPGLENDMDVSTPGHVRPRGGKDPVASWDLIANFSFQALEDKYQALAPTTWHLLTLFMKPKGDDAADTYRPINIVCTSVLSEMIYARNQWTNLFPLCRSISLFASKAHQSIYRVGSRLGQNVPYSTLRSALVEMAHAKRQALRDMSANPERTTCLIVPDNLQAYAKRRDQRIGTANRMITGTGATLIEMQDCPPGAFDLAPIIQLRNERRRRTLTAEQLAADIDMTHLDKVGAYHWLDALVFYVPSLEVYRVELARRFARDCQKQQINPRRRTIIHPLGTNSANEVSTQGMKEAMDDFLEQIGCTPETFDDKVMFFSGDGKTFEGIHTLKKYLDSQPGHFHSFRFVEEWLELWHTRWTDLSRLCRGKWGVSHTTSDPSTLGYLAKAINSPIPSDLRKVEFYPNARLVEVAVKCHMLQCWEVCFDNDDLVKHFNTLTEMDELPSLDALYDMAAKLYRQYATSQAHYQAMQGPDVSAGHPDAAPRFMEDAAPMDIDESAFQGDWALANSVLLMRDGIWFLEAAHAVANGDIGRVWEIVKVWIFTFAGGNNPNYTAYLLEMYCKITFELPEATRTAMFANWLVNLTGEPGHFHENDLMQEHQNFWLEELAQHKGKEFDDEWYRDVLSMHVHHFLRLKDEMETAVGLAPQRKSHTAPHLSNEYTEALRIFREHDLHRHHSGRDFGFHAQDDYTKGAISLARGGKLADFIEESISHRDNLVKEIVVDEGCADASTYLCRPAYYEDGQLVLSEAEVVEE